MRATDALALIQEPQSVDVLLVALQDSNRQVRAAAVAGLQWHNDPRIEAPLITALKDPDFRIRHGVDRLLNSFARDEAIEALIRTWQDPLEDAGVRRICMIAVGRLRDPLNLGLIVAAIKDPDLRVTVADYLPCEPYVRDLVAPYLEDDDPLVRREAMHILGRDGDPRALEPLLAAGRAQNDWFALHKLSTYADPRVVPIVLAALQSADAEIRHSATRVLPAVIGDAAAEKLRPLLADPSYKVRASAIKSLAGLGASEAIGEIMPLLRDENQWVREQAVEALGAFKAAEALEPLMLMVADDPDWSVRASAAEALGLLGDPRAIGVLTQALQDDGGLGNDYYVRDNAREALARLGVDSSET